MIIIFRFNDNRYFGLEIMLQPDVLAAMSSPDAAIINTEKTLGTRMLSDTRWRCTEWRKFVRCVERCVWVLTTMNLEQ